MAKILSNSSLRPSTSLSLHQNLSLHKEEGVHNTKPHSLGGDENAHTRPHTRPHIHSRTQTHTVPLGISRKRHKENVTVLIWPLPISIMQWEIINYYYSMTGKVPANVSINECNYNQNLKHHRLHTHHRNIFLQKILLHCTDTVLCRVHRDTGVWCCNTGIWYCDTGM